MISPTASAISCPAPDPPRCDVTPHDSTTRYLDDFTQVADRRQQRAADGAWTPDRIGFGRQCCVDASCTPDIRHAASTGRASRTIASGTRGGARADRAGLRWSGCHPLAGCSGVVGHRLPPRAAAIRDRESTRHAYALPNCLPSPSLTRHRLQAFPSLCLGPRGRRRARNPPGRSNRLRRVHRAGGATSLGVPHRPRSQNQ
jgi:hypothetical protein